VATAMGAGVVGGGATVARGAAVAGALGADGGAWGGGRRWWARRVATVCNEREERKMSRAGSRQPP
jgi:hypothetical protein